MKKFWQDFKKFISRGNVVDMAVGVAVAGAFTAIVNAFTKGFITPLLVLITGKSDLSSMKWILRPEELNEAGEVVNAEVAIMYGTLLQTIIDFLIIALALFTVMRLYARFSDRAKKLSKSVKEKLTPEDEAAIAKAKAEEEEAARILAEKEAEEKAKAEAELLAKQEAEKQRLLNSVEILEEIRDLLKNKS